MRKYLPLPVLGVVEHPLSPELRLERRRLLPELRAVLVARSYRHWLHLHLEQRVRCAVELPVQAQAEEVLVEGACDVGSDARRVLLRADGAVAALLVHRRADADLSARLLLAVLEECNPDASNDRAPSSYDAAQRDVHLEVAIRVHHVPHAIWCKRKCSVSWGRMEMRRSGCVSQS